MTRTTRIELGNIRVVVVSASSASCFICGGFAPDVNNYSVLHTFISAPMPSISTATVSPSCR